MTAAKRTTIKLTSGEVLDLDRIKEPGSSLNLALDHLTGVAVGPPTPDSQAVHALVVAGLQAVHKHAEEIGYSKLAKFLKTDPEHQAWVASRRARAQRRTGEGETA